MVMLQLKVSHNKQHAVICSLWAEEHNTSVPQLPYSLELAASDYHSFVPVKKC